MGLGLRDGVAIAFGVGGCEDQRGNKEEGRGGSRVWRYQRTRGRGSPGEGPQINKKAPTRASVADSILPSPNLCIKTAAGPPSTTPRIACSHAVLTPPQQLQSGQLPSRQLLSAAVRPGCWRPGHRGANPGAAHPQAYPVYSSAQSAPTPQPAPAGVPPSTTQRSPGSHASRTPPQQLQSRQLPSAAVRPVCRRPGVPAASRGERIGGWGRRHLRHGGRRRPRVRGRHGCPEG